MARRRGCDDSFTFDHGMFLTLTIFLCVAVGVTSMPHIRSATARTARTQRALELGFKLTTPLGFSHVRCVKTLAQRVRVQARVLEEHFKCNELTQTRKHLAAAAFLAAAPFRGTNVKPHARAIRGVLCLLLRLV